VKLAWSFTSDRAVYFQIAERIVSSILAEKYVPGEQLPTVRQLALEAAVNPNTVQRAFSELENDGIIVSRGTLGRFVTEDEEVIRTCRDKQAKQMTENYVHSMQKLSLTKEQVIAMIEEVTG